VWKNGAFNHRAFPLFWYEVPSFSHSPRRDAEDDDSDEDEEQEDDEQDEEEEEEGDEEEEEDHEGPELTRAERRELKKKQASDKDAPTNKAPDEQQGAEEDTAEDDLLRNPNHITKKLNISDMSAPRELTRKERCEHRNCSLTINLSAYNIIAPLFLENRRRRRRHRAVTGR
jgi:hypothetical protein